MPSNGPYVPTTEQVRDGYAAMRDQYSYSPTIAKQREYLANGGGEGEFDRWLREHDAEVIEKLADEKHPYSQAISGSTDPNHVPTMRTRYVFDIEQRSYLHRYAASIRRGED